MTEITQADKDAAARLNGYARWEIWLIVPLHDKEWMQLCAADFARHRIEAVNAERNRLTTLAKNEGFLSVVDIEAGEHETFTRPSDT